MKEHYVSYEQAQALKWLGFDWECLHYYNKEGLLFSNSDSDCEGGGIYVKNLEISHNKKNKNRIDAPALAQAQKWLRNKGLFLIVDMGQDRKHDSKFAWYVNNSNGYIVDVLASEIIYNSYEEALSEGITECLKFLENE